MPSLPLPNETPSGRETLDFDPFVSSPPTTASIPSLPNEILDHIVDFLHDKPDVLKLCCLVSKSWVPRSRTHFFPQQVEFKSPADLKKLKEVFQVPKNSPGSYVRSVSFYHVDQLTDADVAWVRSFEHVVRLDVFISFGPNVSFTPVHNLSPTLKSLSVGWDDLPLEQVFDLICSFPLLEDLHVFGAGCVRGEGAVSKTLCLPPLIGTLLLQTTEAGFARKLLELPGLLRFREIVLKPNTGSEFGGVNDLVGRCSDTLECIDLAWCIHDKLDLSKATRLKKVKFAFRLNHQIRWVILALKDITSDHENFEQVSIYVYCHIVCKTPDELKRAVGEQGHSEWIDLDQALVQLRDLHQIRVKIAWHEGSLIEVQMEECMKYLLPETAMKGGVEHWVGK